METLQNELEKYVLEHGTGYVVDALASAIAMVALAQSREFTPVEKQITKIADDILLEADDDPATKPTF